MFHNLAVDIAFLLIKNKIVDIEQRDIYVYGLEVILLNGSLLLVFLIASLLSGTMINFLAYMIFFLPIRIFSGGFHAKSSDSCFILSTMMYGISIATTAFFPLLYQNWKWTVTGIISIIVILALSPIYHELFCCSYIKADYPPTNSEFVATMAEIIKLNLGKSGSEIYDNLISKDY